MSRTTIKRIEVAVLSVVFLVFLLLLFAAPTSNSEALSDNIARMTGYTFMPMAAGEPYPTPLYR